MAYSPISNTVPQYHVDGSPASGYVLKAYQSGTSTLLQMATAADGLTLVNTVSLNSQGYPVVSGNTVIPHLNAAYKLSLYPTQAAADANSGAIWTVDALTPSSIVANIDFSGNTISSTNTNGDITLDPNGSGNINLNGPTTATTINAQTVDATTLEINNVAVTATAAELNKNDDSAAAVAGTVSAMRDYLFTDPGNSTSSFDFVANVTENTFESVGPTGSGATNIWTALDSLPAAATKARLWVSMSVQPDGVDRISTMVAHARQTGVSTAVGEGTEIARNQVLVDDYTGNTPFTTTIVDVPLDSSRRFDITWVGTNDTARSGIVRLRGFSV